MSKRQQFKKAIRWIELKGNLLEGRLFETLIGNVWEVQRVTLLKRELMATPIHKLGGVAEKAFEGEQIRILEPWEEIRYKL